MPPRSARRPPSATTIDALFRSTKPGAARPGKTKGAPPTSGFPTRAHRRRSTRLTTRARAGANVAIEDDDADTIDDDDAVERYAREPDHLRADADAALVEDVDRILVALPHLAQDVGRIDALTYLDNHATRWYLAIWGLRLQCAYGVPRAP